MFDKLFKHASTRARYATAPFAEERARYLDYCELRGDSRSLQLRKAHDLRWIARKLNSHTELKVTIDQIRALVVNCPHYGDTGGPNLDLLSTRKRLLGHACAWLRYLGYLCEPNAKIQSHLPRQTGNRCAVESPRSANATGEPRLRITTVPLQHWRARGGSCAPDKLTPSPGATLPRCVWLAKP